MTGTDEDDLTDMYHVLDALEAVIVSADPAKREALAKTLDAYHHDFPDEFHWAVGPQSPVLLYHLLGMIEFAGRPPSETKPRPRGRPTLVHSNSNPDGSAT